MMDDRDLTVEQQAEAQRIEDIVMAGARAEVRPIARLLLLAGDVPTGFQTRSTAFGPDFVLELPGVTREEV